MFEEETETLIIDKKYINPIIIPLTCFKDNFDKMNSLFSMNPSLFITKSFFLFLLYI